jgi:hypothetical protein
LFDIELLDVTAGDDVAFALRTAPRRDRRRVPAVAGTAAPAHRGLRKDDGRWVVTHEHHSFALP